MRFHVPALPHTRTNIDVSGIAYTAKTDNFCRMMIERGHEVYSYGREGAPPAQCTEHVAVITREQQVEWLSRGFAWDLSQPYWHRTNALAAQEIDARKQRGDFLCLIGGRCQEPIARAVGDDVMAVEIGIGYPAGGTFARYRVFESYAHQAVCYGAVSEDPTPSLYDAVIPAFFDVSEYLDLGPFVKPPALLFVGRMITRKGVEIALEAARVSGMPLILAGPGGRVEAGCLLTADGKRFPMPPKAEYRGVVSREERNTLMAGASAVLMPTLYMEPFGNVAVEAQLCGTPVITTDFGAFVETVAHGVSGYRCHTLEQFAWAARNAGALDRAAIRRRAVANYGLDRVGLMYEEYFSMLADLWREGWYQQRERGALDWLTAA